MVTVPATIKRSAWRALDRGACRAGAVLTVWEEADLEGLSHDGSVIGEAAAIVGHRHQGLIVDDVHAVDELLVKVEAHIACQV